MLEHSAEYKRKCKEVCSEQEYTILEKAFFNKEKTPIVQKKIYESILKVFSFILYQNTSHS